MIHYTFYARVLKVEEHFTKLYRSGLGDKAVFEDASQGWYMHLNGSHEMLYIGDIKPEIEPGDLVKIVVHKIKDQHDAKPG